MTIYLTETPLTPLTPQMFFNVWGFLFEETIASPGSIDKILRNTIRFLKFKTDLYKGGNRMSEDYRELVLDVLYMLGMMFIPAYPIGRYVVPEQPWQAQFCVGAFIAWPFCYLVFMTLIAPWLYKRRWKKKQQEKEVLNAARR